MIGSFYVNSSAVDRGMICCGGGLVDDMEFVLFMSRYDSRLAVPSAFGEKRKAEGAGTESLIVQLF